MKELLNAGQVLGRSEMKKIMAGSGGTCTVTCNNCQNSSCQQTVPDCSTSSVYSVCGPGYHGGGGPVATCVC